VDIVAEPLISSGVNINEAREISKDLLNRLSIPLKLFNAYPSTFSGGEQQRVNIARAVIRRQRLLMIDEPTASLDHKATEIVLEIFNELKNAGTAMIGVFHDKEVLSDFSDEIYYLEA
jgi:alpha-D-ribose 1-methylphosphonate 5-triphosphate synthase subunit PhnL